MTVARTHRAHRICLWLTLALAAAHALIPLGSPLARAPGSAFSAFTADVSLGPSRRGGLAGKKKALAASADRLDRAGSAPADLAFVLISDPSAPAARRPAPDAAEPARGPVAAAHIPVGFQPRAPPRA